MEIKKMQCPSCGAYLAEKSYKGEIIVCSYCNSVLYADNLKETDINQVESKRLTMPYFCYGSTEAYIEKIDEFLKKIIECQKNAQSMEELENHMLNMLYMKPETATENWKIDHFKKMSEKIKLAEGEELIMYKTAALLGINKLKTGMFITNRRVGYYDFGKIYSYEYIEIDNILITHESGNVIWILPNSNDKLFISGYGVSIEEEALIAAYLISRISEAKHNYNNAVEIKTKYKFYQN